MKILPSTLIIFTAMFGIFGIGGYARAEVPVRWEHGWKTSRVIATRMHSDTIGWNIKFDFPKNGYDSDRAEVSWFIEMHGGNVFEGGGAPYASAYAQFDDVKDVTAADKKLQEILPGLTTLLANLDNKTYCDAFEKKYKAWDLAHNPQWPDTTPPDKTDPLWELNNNLSMNGTPYKKVEVSPGKWQWKVDEETQRLNQKYEDDTWDLYRALSARKLTHSELLNVYEGMNVRNMQTYFQVDIDAAMYDSLVKQWELQTGHKMDGYRPLSTTKGEYNRSPQEEDNKQAVVNLIHQLQSMTTAK